MGNLEGRTVVVTRPKSQAAPLVRALQKEEAKVILCPAIRIKSLLHSKNVRRFFQSLSKEVRLVRKGFPWFPYDRIIFLSANAVRLFHKGWAQARIPGPPPRIVVVGPETARAVKQAGWRVAQTAKVYNARGVLTYLRMMKGERILLPRVRGGPEHIVRALRKRHAVVRVLSLYETTTAPVPKQALKHRIIQQADAILFTSPSAVRYFCLFFNSRERSALFMRAKSVCMGLSTLGELKNHGITGKRPNHSTSISLVKAARRALRSPA